MSLSNTYENRVADWLVGGAPTQPTEFNIALFSGDPADGGGGTEVSQTEYNRQTVGVSNLSVSGNTISNDNDIGFGKASVDWDLFDHYAAYDQNGDLIGAGALDKQYDIDADQEFILEAGQMTIDMD